MPDPTYGPLVCSPRPLRETNSKVLRSLRGRRINKRPDAGPTPAVNSGLLPAPWPWPRSWKPCAARPAPRQPLRRPESLSTYDKVSAPAEHLCRHTAVRAGGLLGVQDVTANKRGGRSVPGLSPSTSQPSPQAPRGSPRPFPTAAGTGLGPDSSPQKRAMWKEAPSHTHTSRVPPPTFLTPPLTSGPAPRAAARS